MIKVVRGGNPIRDGRPVIGMNKGWPRLDTQALQESAQEINLVFAIPEAPIKNNRRIGWPMGLRPHFNAQVADFVLHKLERGSQSLLGALDCGLPGFYLLRELRR